MGILTDKEIYLSYKLRKQAIKGINSLKDKNLLPLMASASLSSIVGHLIGDGNLSKDPYIGDFKFYGTKDKLDNIRIKIWNTLKIKPSEFYERKGGFVLRYNNCLIARILSLIGVPRGNKTFNSFTVPEWIMIGNEEIKRAFLISICDDELSTPRFDKKGNIEPLRLKFNKNQKFIGAGIRFLEDVKQLFSDFNIKCSSIKINNETYINAKNEISRSIYFNISAKRYNLLTFLYSIGFEAERLKQERLISILFYH